MPVLQKRKNVFRCGSGEGPRPQPATEVQAKQRGGQKADNKAEANRRADDGRPSSLNDRPGHAAILLLAVQSTVRVATLQAH